MSAELLTDARTRAQLSKAELARRAGTSRETLSAYEHGSKSPNLSTFERIIASAGFSLALHPVVRFEPAGAYRGAPVLVPDRLPSLPPERATAVIDLPRHLEWSGEERRKDLAVRADRVRVYELVLREGTPEDVTSFIDPTLLVDAFCDLNLPAAVRSAWAPTIERWRGRRSTKVRSADEAGEADEAGDERDREPRADGDGQPASDGAHAAQPPA